MDFCKNFNFILGRTHISLYNVGSLPLCLPIYPRMCDQRKSSKYLLPNSSCFGGFHMPICSEPSAIYTRIHQSVLYAMHLLHHLVSFFLPNFKPNITNIHWLITKLTCNIFTSSIALKIIYSNTFCISVSFPSCRVAVKPNQNVPNS